MKKPEFDDLRPYYDEEIPAAMRRIAEHRYFPLLASYVFPEREVEDVRAMLLAFKTINDFQAEVMRQVNKRIIAESVTEFTYSGLENLPADKPCLFVSNHRDIMLDASLLNLILIENGMETTEITFGSNLMQEPLIVDIGRSNKMFKVIRGCNAKEFYNNSMHLSAYIRHCLTQEGSSVWIAQRNGRTKDGNDATDQGIINMFAMSGSGDKLSALTELNIVPVSVSYEWEPCDFAKVKELYHSRERKYIKSRDEDIRSILSGILMNKGRVHFSICKALSESDISSVCDSKKNVFHKNVASLIDERILEAYKLFPNNYIASDLRSGSGLYEEYYTKEEQSAFLARLSELESGASSEEAAILRSIFLGIYANPLDNKKL